MPPNQDHVCPQPIGPQEIAQMLNVTRQRVTQLRAGPGFPKPWVSLATGHIWRDSDIVEWAKSNGRTIHPLD